MAILNECPETKKCGKGRSKGEKIMGYCSDVALIMKNTAWDAVRDYFADNTDVGNTLDRARVISYRNEYTILSWTSLKWTEPIHTIIVYLNNEGYDYHYARVGEAMEDTEESLAEEDDIMNDAFYIPHYICYEDKVAGYA